MTHLGDDGGLLAVDVDQEQAGPAPFEPELLDARGIPPAPSVMQPGRHAQVNPGSKFLGQINPQLHLSSWKSA